MQPSPGPLPGAPPGAPQDLQLQTQTRGQQNKIFVGGLSWETTDEKLAQYFSNYGEVTEAFVSFDRNTGRPRGFGFVCFADPSIVDKVVSQGKHHIDRREVEAKKAVPKEETPTPPAAPADGSAPQKTRKIFVGGLAPSVDDSVLRQYFEQFGGVEDAVVMYDHDNKRPRGFGFITFAEEDSVDKVFEQGAMQSIHDKQIEIKPAVPRDQMPPVRRGGVVGPGGALMFPGATGLRGAVAPGRGGPTMFPGAPSGWGRGLHQRLGAGAPYGIRPGPIQGGTYPGAAGSSRGIGSGPGGYGAAVAAAGAFPGTSAAGVGFPPPTTAAQAAGAIGFPGDTSGAAGAYSGMYGGLGASGAGPFGGAGSQGGAGGLYSLGSLQQQMAAQQQQQQAAQQQQQQQMGGGPFTSTAGQLTSDMAKLGALGRDMVQAQQAAAAAAAQRLGGGGTFGAFGSGSQGDSIGGGFGGATPADVAAAAAAAAAAGFGQDGGSLSGTGSLTAPPDFSSFDGTFGRGTAGGWPG